MAGLFYKGNVFGIVPARTSYVIANSATITKGGFVKFSDANFAAAVTAGDRISFFAEDFLVTDPQSGGEHPVAEAENSQYDGTYTAGGEGVGSYVATSDNQTDKKVRVRGFWVSEGDRFASVPDATLGTTTGSDSAGYYTDLANAYTVDEDTAATTAAQLSIHGIDPLDSTRAIYSVAERQTTR